jgi:hypothetical protein
VCNDSRVGFSYRPRGYYQRKEKLALPEAIADGLQEFNFVDGTTLWWFTRPGALPFRYVTKREFLHKQIEIVRARSTPLWLKGTAPPSQSIKRSDRIPAPKSTA